MNMKPFILTKNERKEIEDEKKNYEHVRAVLIEALKIVQKNHGWISDEAIKEISKVLNISIEEIEGVATFYSNIFRQQVGRNIIRYCDGVVCYITGYQKIYTELIKLLHIKPGQTTIDGRFTLLPTCCLGNCDKGPSFMINDDTYTHLNQKNICLLLEKYK